MVKEVVRDLFVDRRRAFRERLLRGSYGVKRLVAHEDLIDSVLGEIAAFGDHDRDRLADEPDFLEGERVHVGLLVAG